MPDGLMNFAGHYPLYVLPAYGLSALTLLVLIIDSLLRARKWRRAAEHRDRLRTQSKGDEA